MQEIFIRQRMQKTLYQTADAGDSLSDSGCRSLLIRQRMQESLYQRADAGETLSDSGCTLSDRETPHKSDRDRQRMQESLYIRCLIESLLHLLSDRESPASAAERHPCIRQSDASAV